MKILKEKIIEKKLLIGWNEWCQLPDLNVPAIKAKIDTGAQTSAIHAVNIKPVVKNHKDYVRFDIYPIQGNTDVLVNCRAPIVDKRYIMSSNGHKEDRFVINTLIEIGRQGWPIELTLSNRDPLRYRMLLGREAMHNRVLIHPGIDCHQGRITQEDLLDIYTL